MCTLKRPVVQLGETEREGGEGGRWEEGRSKGYTWLQLSTKSAKNNTKTGKHFE